jgi:hypothetical protein
MLTKFARTWRFFVYINWERKEGFLEYQAKMLEMMGR